jgi:hypothetical protein
VGAAALALYLALAPRVAGEGDASELTLVLAVGGVPHPTGYPLYTILGHLFCSALHALGAGWWYAANAWSAVGAALAVFLLHALAARLTPAEAGLGRGARFAAALVPVLVFAFNPVWLDEATLAEVNSWHVAWAAGACLACLALLGRILDGRPFRPARGAALWGMVCGLGLAHHVTAVFFVVPLTAALAWALWRAHRWRAALLGAAALGALLPLASYGFVWYRALHPAAFQWPLLDPSPASVLAHARGAYYGIFVGRFAPSAAQGAELAADVYPFLVPGLLLLALTLLRAAEDAERTLLTAAIAAAVAQSFCILIYGVPDPAAYFLAPLAVALLALPRLAVLAAGRPARGAALGLATLAAIGILAACWLRTVPARDARLAEVEARVRRAWSAIPYERGIVLWRNDLYSRLEAYQLLDGEKPGLFVENPNMLTWAGPRAAFARRFGFDALAGLELRTDADLAAVPGNVGRQTGLPVIDFDEWLAATSTPAP